MDILNVSWFQIFHTPYFFPLHKIDSMQSYKCWRLFTICLYFGVHRDTLSISFVVNIYNTFELLLLLISFYVCLIRGLWNNSKQYHCCLLPRIFHILVLNSLILMLLEMKWEPFYIHWSFRFKKNFSMSSKQHIVT